jgi:hypothetical protein
MPQTLPCIQRLSLDLAKVPLQLVGKLCLILPSFLSFILSFRFLLTRKLCIINDLQLPKIQTT